MIKNREFKLVHSSKIHPSSILPPRKYSSKVLMSVGKVGIQQPPIVRPIPNKPGEYEYIDGHDRARTFKSDQEVLVDVRYNIKDLDVLKISQATFERTNRSAYETALFYAEWMKILQREKGKDEGLQSILAQETNLTESAISQYLSIYKTFEKLKSLSPIEEFNALKNWSVNKLYKIAEISEDPDFLEVARELEKKGDISIEEIEYFLSDRKSKQIEDALFPPDEDGQNAQESETDSDSAEKPLQHTQYKNYLTCAQKVNKLEIETHDKLSPLVKEMVSNAEKFSTSEIYGILTSLLQVLKKLKKHTDALNEKVKSQGKWGAG